MHLVKEVWASKPLLFSKTHHIADILQAKALGPINLAQDRKPVPHSCTRRLNRKKVGHTNTYLIVPKGKTASNYIEL